MAGDWIKMESGTPDKPEVWAIAESLDLDPDAVFGKLFRIWSWFDQHTEEGNAPTVSKKLLDRLVGVSGFCDEVILAGWMVEDGNTITLPNFDRHNGKTAKNRAVTAKRVAKHKEKTNGDSVTPSVSKALPREEKRREDISKGFNPPTQMEVLGVMKEKGIENAAKESEKFVNFYSSKGWMVGSNKMKSWPHAVGNWCANLPQKQSASFGSDAI